MTMAKLARPEALYKLLASELRDAIHTGEYAAGTLLPSENTLVERYGVSKPTVRLALSTLRGEGLIRVVNGKGSYVRDTPTTTPPVTVTRDPHDPTHGITLTGQPEHSRHEADGRIAALLGIDEQDPLYILDRTATDDATGRTVLTRRILPFTATEGTTLETQPHPDRPELLRVLRDKHGELTTHLLTRAYLPHPDEATTLGIPEATPVLETTWLTQDPGGYTVLAEIERANADGVHYAFRSALS